MTMADAAAPLCLHEETVRREWIDYNGHLNMAYYMLVFDHATDALLDHLGMDRAYRARTGGTVYTLEGHITYERELHEGDPLRVETQLLDHDAKRLHYFHTLHHARAGYLAATTELIVMHIDTRAGRASPMPAQVQARVASLMAAHRTLARPAQVGRVIGIRRKR